MRFPVGGAVVLAMAGPAGAQQVDQSALGAMGPSVTSAQAELVVWCNLIKDGSARAAWDRASPRLKSIYTVENWQQAWSGVVGTLQPITNRKITAVRYVPADADRNPEAVVFDTRVEFQGETFGGETVVVALEAGAWRVWDYAISPSSQYLARYPAFYSRPWIPVPRPTPAPAADNRIINRVNPRKVPEGRGRTGG